MVLSDEKGLCAMFASTSGRRDRRVLSEPVFRLPVLVAFVSVVAGVAVPAGTAAATTTYSAAATTTRSADATTTHSVATTPTHSAVAQRPLSAVAGLKPWTVVATPSNGAPLYGVSCTSTSMCVAVGGPGALIESWDGSSWTITPSPSEGDHSILWSTSCASPVDCVAVGNYTPAGTKGQQTLIESFDGTSWSFVSSPNSASHNNLYGVSCTSEHFCMAVGFSYTGPDPIYESLVETWNGRNWSVGTDPDIGELTGVSCVSSSDCTVTGANQLATWNGTAWTVPSITLGANDSLTAVTCESASQCVAVGQQMVSSSPDFRTLVLFRHGKNWYVVPSPNRGPATGTGATDNQLLSVSCTSGEKCVAVGDGNGSLVELWNGKSWRIVPSGNLGSHRFDALYGSSCPAPTSCEAVGSYGNNKSLAETGGD